MSTQEIIRELTKLDRDELAQIDLKLHELLEKKIRTGGRSISLLRGIVLNAVTARAGVIISIMSPVRNGQKTPCYTVLFL